MTKQQEKQIEETMKNIVDSVKFKSMSAGATGILGAVLDMCNTGKSVEDIKQFCETSLNLDGMKQEREG